MGGSMTAISLRHPHCGRLNRTDITAAIKVGRLISDGGGYSVGPAHLCEQLELTSDSSGCQSCRLNKLSLSDNRSTRSGQSVESSLTNFTAGFLNSPLMRKACSGATWKGSTSN